MDQPESIKTCVIIGHGDSPKGCKWGSEIDKHVVVRLKDPSWQGAEDYGTRTDYMCASTETMQVMLDYKKIPIEYWGQPKKGSWSVKSERNFRERAKAPLKIPINIHNRWSVVFKSMAQTCPNHSIGMAAITFAAEFLKPAEILLVGFDNMLDPDRLDYYKANKGKWVTGHEWHVENKMIPLVEKAHGVVIRRFI